MPKRHCTTSLGHFFVSLEPPLSLAVAILMAVVVVDSRWISENECVI